MLVERFIKKMNNIRGRSVADVSKEAMSILLTHNYPGNIRELENIIEHAFVLCHEGEIEKSHLPPSLLQLPKDGVAVSSSIEESVRLSEEESIMAALKRNNFNRLAAAKDLGIHKSTLFRKLKKYDISLPERDGRSAGQ
jgi:transcriptional regulator with PAS, ATPase and Fis domain